MKNQIDPVASPSLRRRWTVAVALAAAALAGCATVQTSGMEQAARQRAEQRWQFLIQRNLEAAWGMHAEGWRALNPYAAWQVDFGRSVEWLAARTTGATCEAAPAPRCTVQVTVSARPTGLPFKDVPRDAKLSEVWILQGGQWWMVPPDK